MTAATSLPPGPGLTVRGVLRGEWSKLWSLRSTRWIALGVIVVPIVLGIARAAVAAPAWVAGADGTAAALESIALGTLPAGFIAALLGLVTMGSELTGEVFAGTLLANPRRYLVVVAKCAASFVVAFVSALIGLAGAGVIGGLILSARGHEQLPVATMAEIAVLGALAASLLSTMGVASATLARTTTSATLQLAAVLAVVPVLVGIVAERSAQWVTDLLPATAIQAVVTRPPAAAFTVEGVPPSALDWIPALTVLVGWAGAYLLAALVVINHRTVWAPQSRRVRGPASRSRGLTVAGLSFAALLRSELLKLATVPAPRWLLGLGMMVFAAVALLSTGSVRLEDSLSEPVMPGDRALAISWVQVQILASGAGLAQLFLAAFGAIAVTSEFASGSIGPTLIAAPRRVQILAAKGILVLVISTAVSLTMVFGTTMLAITVFRRLGIEAELSAAVVEGALRCSLACTLIAMVGFALGAVLRTPLAALAGIVSILVLVPSVLSPLQFMTRGTPIVMIANAVEFFPALPIAITVLPGNSSWPQFLDGGVLQLHPDQALLVIVAWAMVGATVAAVVFRRQSV